MKLFYFSCFKRRLPLLVGLLASSCDGNKARVDGDPNPSMDVKEVGKANESTLSDKKEPAASTNPNDFPLLYGRGKRIIDSDSDDFKKITEAIHSSEGGALHDILFVVELEQGGMEVQTRKINASYGWAIRLTFDEAGEVLIKEKEYWRN